MPSTLLAYPQVISRRFASSNSIFPQLTGIFGAGSIPGSSTKELAGHSPKITVHKLHVKTWVVERALDSDS
jgi:hypothetical protein